MPPLWKLAVMTGVDAKQSGTILVQYQFATPGKLSARLLSEHCVRTERVRMQIDWAFVCRQKMESRTMV